MNKRNTAITGGLALALTMGFMGGAYADDAIKKISAHLNTRMTMQVDGHTVDLSDPEGKEELAPIVYQGRSYVPAKPLAEALGAKVSWEEATETVVITSAEKNPDPAVQAEPRASESKAADKGTKGGGQSDPEKPNEEKAEQEKSGKETSDKVTSDKETSDKEKSAEETSGGKLPVTYPADTTPSRIFDDYKSAAREGLNTYIYALRTMNTDEKLREYVYKVYPEGQAAGSPADVYRRVSSGLELTRGRMPLKEVKESTEGVLAALNSRDFPDRTSGYDATEGLTLHYQAHTDDEAGTLVSVQFKFVKSGNTYKLSDLAFFGTLAASADGAE
ncbi:stalk domain-containing protein [Paenibacillus sp. S-38]|uniref:stalk domain-containing protein n=1 Tax=Paenibacillus sp. S-38 TaxID=3416710 RepID=UPI003CE94D50